MPHELLTDEEVDSLVAQSREFVARQDAVDRAIRAHSKAIWSAIDKGDQSFYDKLVTAANAQDSGAIEQIGQQAAAWVASQG